MWVLDPKYRHEDFRKRKIPRRPMGQLFIYLFTMLDNMGKAQ